jgi:HD-like signal output (HDOD) protein
MLSHLFRQVDDSDHEGNREFVARLVRIIGTEKLDMPPFPDVARQLDKLLRQAEVPINKVVKLAEREPALVKRIWQMACSSAFAEPPTSFQYAVARVGFDSLWQIAMSTCVYDAVFRVRGYEGEVDRIRQHGVVAAEVAAWLAPDEKGQVYLSGLLHDIGKLMIYRAAVTRPGKPAPSPEYVDQVVRLYHASLGVLVAQSWKLGDWVSAGIAFHHDPSRAAADQQDIAWIVHAANVATHTAEKARNGQECGGMMALLEIDSFSFDVARTIEKAHSMFDQLNLPGPPS